METGVRGSPVIYPLTRRALSLPQSSENKVLSLSSAKLVLGDSVYIHWWSACWMQRWVRGGRRGCVEIMRPLPWRSFFQVSARFRDQPSNQARMPHFSLELLPLFVFWGHGVQSWSLWKWCEPGELQIPSWASRQLVWALPLWVTSNMSLNSGAWICHLLNGTGVLLSGVMITRTYLF